MQTILALFIVVHTPKTGDDSVLRFLGILALIALPGISLRAFNVLKRRKRGESWNEAIAEGTKLATGNVWLDGAVILAVGLITFAAIWLGLTFA